MRLKFGVTIIAMATALTSLPVGNVAHASASCAGTSTGGDWAKYGQDLTNDRHQTQSSITAVKAAALAPGFVLSASGVGATGNFTGTPLVFDGCVFVATNTGFVVAANADTGELVWKTKLSSGVTSLTQDGGRIFADVSVPSAPKVAALSQATGDVLWEAIADTQKGSDFTGSPTAYDGMVITGFSGIGAEVASGGDRLGFRGGYTIFDGASGDILHKEYVIPDAEFAQGYAGGGIWSTPAVDTDTKVGYMGTGNPFGALEHANTNAMISVDLDRNSATFGEILRSFKGHSDQYFAPLQNIKPVCGLSPSLGSCELLDLDFGASPHLITGANGRKLVGDLQKSGVYHAVDATTMEGVWEATVSFPFLAGNSASPAFDGSSVVVSATETLTSLNSTTSLPEWNVPAGGSGYNTPAISNGVVYVAAHGVLTAVSSASGSLIGAYPISSASGQQGTSQDGGVTLARNTVYANNGAVIVAYR